MSRTLLFAALLLVGPAAAAQAGWPPGPSTYAHDAATLVALPHQRAALGLSDDQAAALDALSRTWLDQVHDVRGDLRSLREAIHVYLGEVEPGAPMDPEQAVALFADIDRHEAEVRTVFREGAEAALAVLSADQRAAWERTLVEALGRAGEEGPP